MVKIYAVILCLCFGSLAYGQIYVNATATGANNGTTWANAFTKVESALAATGNNIWIARGTYKPEGAANDTTVSFRMTNSKNIYGGFAGTETTLAARNIALNPTILNGDMLGNDNVDSLYFNKLDNRRHVLFIDSLVRGTIILDGLTVSGGATKDITSGTNRRESSGGGVLSYTSLVIRNCRFLNNFARLGGGVCILGDSLYTSDVLVENTTFEKNITLFAGTSGAGIYTTLIDSLVLNNVTAIRNYAVQGSIANWTGNYIGINSCTITENRNNTAATLGAGLLSVNIRHQNIQNSFFTKNTSNTSGGSLGAFIQNTAFQTDPNNSTTINNCVFRENESTASSVAALQIVQGNKITITNSEFVANRSFTNSNVFLNSSASIFGKADNLLVRNCKFFNNVVENTATVVGSALYTDSNTGLIIDCEFSNNRGIRGPHLSFRGENPNPSNDAFRPCVITVRDCSFNGGISTAIGGATYSQLRNGIVIFTRCTFTANKGSSGGASWHGFRSKTEYYDCDFLLNEGAGSGGALFFQTDTSTLIVKDSRFTSNMTTSGSGGAIGSTSNQIGFVIINNDFIANSTTGFGGALNLGNSANRDLAIAATLIDRNLFEENISSGQGGALNISNRTATIQNNIFLRNDAPNDGIGGAISYNHSDTLLRKEIKVINNTFIGNKGALVSGIIAWQSKAANKRGNGLVSVQNNIFMEQIALGNEPNDTTFNAEIKSLGGNILINSASMPFISASLDQVSPSFSLNDSDFSLKPGSTAINYGIGAGAPLYDYNNLLRIGRPDAGAIEFGATVNGIKASDIKSLMIYPNPSADYIKVDELAVSNARYLIFSLDGKLADKGSIPSNGQIDIKKLTVGNYYLQVNDGKVNIGSFVKQ